MLSSFFKGKKINDDEQKHALLVSLFSPATFHLVKSLVQPAKLKDKPYADLVKLLSEHYNPKPSAIVCYYHFNVRDRNQSESVST